MRAHGHSAPIRLACTSRIVECVQQWWGSSRTPAQARELSLLLPKLFLQFFSSTSLVLEDDAGIRAFLVGFHAADNAEEAYIHFVGVDPTLRGSEEKSMACEGMGDARAAFPRTQVRRRVV